MSKKREDISPPPEHVAIIMDGNGRWARERGLIRSMGHERGGHQVKEILREAFNLGVKQLTLYAFSSENWKRPKKEVNFLHNLLVKFLRNETGPLNDDNVYFRTLGDLDAFPQKVQKEIENSKEVLKDNDGITLCLALNYGSRAEIVNAAKNYGRDLNEGNIKEDELSEDRFADYLETSEMKEVDFLIRTAGEQRISNYLLWQISYAELYFTDVYWPDFSPKDFGEAIDTYRKRHRRFGGL